MNMHSLLSGKLYYYTFVALFLSLSHADLFGQPNRAYDRGLEEIYRGNVSQALDFWFDSYMSEPNTEVDSRIGFEFIRVVTEQKMRSYYEAATLMYYRALTDGTGMESRVALRQEIDRMKPLIGDGIYRQWTEWWTQRSDRLGFDMRGYWIQQDPTPAAGVNERLIEHWIRIHNATQIFNKNSNTVYGTDDRALIYIRYGEPSRRSSGILTLQSQNIKPWLQRQLNAATSRGAISRRGDDLSEPQEFDELIERLQRSIYEFHRYPEYEIWFYENIVPDQAEPIIFLFGTDVRTDQFSLQTSLEDFVPERAYIVERSRNDEPQEFTRAGITPALMLQLLYYEQLARIDSFFERRLNDLRDYVLDQGLEAYRGLDQIFKSESRELVNVRQLQVPNEKSSFEEMLPRIPMNIHQYRYLDLDNDLRPSIITYIESEPQEAFLIDFHRNRGRSNGNGELFDTENILEEFPFYELRHSLQKYDRNWNLLGLLIDQPSLVLNRGEQDEFASTYFTSLHTNRSQVAASVQLFNHDPDSRTIDETPFPPAIRGWNKLQYRQPPPLRSHSDSLEVADLVLGYPDTTGVTEPFSFRVANNQIIPFGQTLLLHFEVYNLKRMSDGFTHFELTYRILPVDDEGWVLSDQTEFILTLNFINEDIHVVEDLEIETADLSPGLYEIIVLIIDTESEQERQRRVRFEVVEG